MTLWSAIKNKGGGFWRQSPVSDCLYTACFDLVLLFVWFCFLHLLNCLYLNLQVSSLSLFHLSPISWGRGNEQLHRILLLARVRLPHAPGPVELKERERRSHLICHRSVRITVLLQACKHCLGLRQRPGHFSEMCPRYCLEMKLGGFFLLLIYKGQFYESVIRSSMEVLYSAL